jgi:cell division protein ZapB
MADLQNFDRINERVERLLLRHQELQRTNALLHQQIHSLQSERDSLRLRLQAGRTRIDALLERLPLAPPHTTQTTAPTPSQDSQ